MPTGSLEDHMADCHSITPRPTRDAWTCEFCGAVNFDGSTECGDCGEARCPATTPAECAMMRERAVAGLSNDIPSCPVHGAWSE